MDRPTRLRGAESERPSSVLLVSLAGMARRGRQPTEAEVGLFLHGYGRSSRKTVDPNDRSYDREVEQLVRRMRPEDLDRLMRDERDAEP